MKRDAEFAYEVGIDENGLGPRLGPLVVTGALAKIRDEAAAKWLRTPSRWPVALDDSKALVDYHDSSLGEAWIRAILARSGISPRSPAEVVALISLDPSHALTAPCPGHLEAQCWSTSAEAFVCTDAQVGKVQRTLDSLAARGIELLAPRTVLTCTKKLNEAAASGRSRFDVDLQCMERLVLDARDRASENVHAVCGKVGGFDFYDTAFDALSGHLRTELVAGRAKSTYHFPALGRVSFERDADARHALVAVASLVGKWLRDMLMRRVVRFYREHDASLPEPSGYHDPVTSLFISGTRAARRRLEVHDNCFERKRVEKAAKEPASGVARAISALAEP